ncbi:MAG: CBS domain-containing protein [Firmicutes bacterium]|nr:CBS domain-containing protein [Bacillota bacterium]
MATAPTRVRLLARDVMTTPVITVAPDTPVKEIAQLLLTHHISGVPVVSPEGKLVGVVTEADLLYKERPEVEEAGLLRLFRRGQLAEAERKAEGLVARDVMSSPVVTVTEETPLREVAALMARRQINRVPVVRGDQVVGIVSRADVLRALVRADDEIKEAVRRALLEELWIDPSGLRIEVQEGVVTLEGEVERRSDKELAERWVATIDGVVRVESRLTYRFDDRQARMETWPGDPWRNVPR